MTKPTTWFSRDEIRQLTQASDLQGWRDVLGDWAIIAATFALVAIWPNAATVLAALVLLAGRQLALAILSHEATHRSLFRTRWLNDVVGTWLCAAPIWLDVARYRGHHLRHHVHTGGPEDPDLGLVEPYPTDRPTLVRRLLRDLTGQTGLRRLVGQFLMDVGVLSYTVSTGAERLPPKPWSEHLALGLRHLGPVLLTNAVLFGILALVGHPWLYVLWGATYLTTYSAVLRIRSIAEHACTPGGTDMLQNTRTTLATWPMRLLLAPHHVNFHVEHHLMMTVPHWRLPAVHARLQQAGVLGPHNTAPGYLTVLSRASGR